MAVSQNSVVSADVPVFTAALFSANEVDLHAACVRLPFGGSGVLTHTEPQLSFLASGRAWVAAGDFRGWVEPGSLIVLPAGPRMNVVAPGTVSYSVGLGTGGPLGHDAVTATLATVQGRASREWLDRIVALCERPPTDRSELNAAFAPFVARAVERRAGRRHELVRAFFLVLEQSLDHPLTLRELGERFGYAPNHFGDLIRVHTGRSVRQWQILLRLDRARRALRDPGQPIAGVAASVGFDPVFFARTFHRRYGLTPTQWRHAVTAPSNIASMAQRLDVDGVVRITAHSA